MTKEPPPRLSMHLLERVKTLQARFQQTDFAQKRLRPTLKLAQIVFTGGVLIYLIWRLSQIGWGALLGAFPTHPAFYLLSILIFIAVPLCEVITYRLIIGQWVKGGLRIFSRKRVFNEALLNFTGEAYLCERLAAQTHLSTRQALIAIKDNNLVSALLSNSWAIFLVILVLLVGRADVLQTIWQTAPILISLFALVCLILYLVVFRFLSHLTRLPARIVWALAGLHAGKILLVAGAQIAQWVSALPAESLQTWGLFLTLQILLKRIPGLPNADLIFLTIGLSIAGFAYSAPETVSAMLLASVASLQIVYFLVFLITIRLGADRHTDTRGTDRLEKET